MFSVIVVDDEMMIRTSISAFINNCDVGFEVVGTFRDGSDAIKYLEENNVDLVISDIRMVQVSGIDLAQYIYENKPWTQVILLSGYTDFEYAKAAIKYNVKEYITKPTDFENLKNSLINMKNLLTEQKNNNINSFFDNIMHLYAEIVSINLADAKETLFALLDKNTHKNERLGQYAFNDFSIKMLENIIKQLSAKNKKTDNIVVDKLIQFINDNFSKNISLQDAAESVFFNPAYCSRFFKEQTGENFSNYLLKVRMEHAVKLLKENKKINDISKECGYQSPGYFTRVFKDYYNCTPSEYLHNS